MPDKQEIYVVTHPHSSINPSNNHRVVRYGDFVKVYNHEVDASKMPYVAEFSSYAEAQAEADRLSSEPVISRLNKFAKRPRRDEARELLDILAPFSEALDAAGENLSATIEALQQWIDDDADRETSSAARSQLDGEVPDLVIALRNLLVQLVPDQSKGNE